MSVQSMIERWVRPEIRALKAYHVADPGKMIKLDAMENPYTWPEAVRNEWLSCLEGAKINRYPSPRPETLIDLIKSEMKVPNGADIILGNGSDELIQLMMLSMQGGAVMAPTPTFVMYEMTAKFVDMPFVSVPLTADFDIDLEATLALIESEQPALIFLAYPNNPTGNLFKRDDIEAIIEAADGWVIIDEAYYAFSEDSYIERVLNYDNVMVMRTVSKVGLAGLRLGFLVGAPEIIEEINKVRMPYNINVLTQMSVQFALEHHDILQAQAAELCEQRTSLMDELAQIDGFQVYPTQANFILVRVGEGEASPIFEGLKTRGVLIKNLSGHDPALQDCLRITVSTPEENAQFMQALNATLEVIRG